MKTATKIIFLGLVFATAAWIFPRAASAASFNVVLDKNSGAIGDEFTADIRINSEGVGINAAQATLQFPTDTLQAVSIDKTSSVFNFWLEDPTFSNQTGKVTFVGGSTSGFSGASLKVISITFKVKGSGQANFAFSDGAITASDGSGTNVLAAMNGAQFNAVPTGQVPAPAIPSPQQITRPPTSAQNLPALPNVQVPLYPSAQNWYNVSAPFTAQWDLPSDISAVATAVNKNPTSIPQTSEGLFNNKTFSALSDGVWYLHVRFENNIGWGPTAHYRIAVDTAPPQPFTITVNEGTSTDNPTPTINYGSSDNLSGIDHYTIQIGDGDPITLAATKYTLPLQAPGNHTINVSAQDKAGNTTQASLALTIVPIDSPVVRVESTDVFAGEGGLVLGGTALPGVNVLLSVQQKNGKEVYASSVKAQPDGS